MADILKNLNNIKKAVYGKDVRSSIVDSMEAINEESKQAYSIANNIDKKFNEQIKNITLDDPSSVEIVAMRTNMMGTTYKTAGARLDAIDEKNNNNILKITKLENDIKDNIYKTTTAETMIKSNTNKLTKVEGDIKNNINKIESLDNIKRSKSDKITSNELDVSSDSNKIKMINLSDEVKQAMAGKTSIYASVANNSLTSEKYAKGSVNYDAILKQLQMVYLYGKDGIFNFDIDIINKCIRIDLPKAAFFVLGTRYYECKVNQSNRETIMLNFPTTYDGINLITYNVVTKEYKIYNYREFKNIVDNNDLLIFAICSTALGGTVNAVGKYTVNGEIGNSYDDLEVTFTKDILYYVNTRKIYIPPFYIRSRITKSITKVEPIKCGLATNTFEFEFSNSDKIDSLALDYKKLIAYTDTVSNNDNPFIFNTGNQIDFYGKNIIIATVLNGVITSQFNIQYVKDSNYYNDENNRLVVPDAMYFIKGDELTTYKSSLIPNANAIDNMKISLNYVKGYIPSFEYFYEDIKLKESELPEVFRFAVRQYNTNDLYYKDIIKKVVDPAIITKKSPTILHIGDSLTNRKVAYWNNIFLTEKGLNPIFVGTISNQGDKLGEGREGWSYSNFVGRSNTRIDGSVISLQTDGTNSDINKNPFLRLATDTDKNDHPNWCFRNTGAKEELNYNKDDKKAGDFYIFDFDNYLKKYRIQNPDIVTIALSTNDINTLDCWQDSCSLGLEIMYSQIRNALPNVKIGIVPTPGWNFKNTNSTKAYKWIEQCITQVKEYQKIDSKLFLVPVWCFINRDWSNKLKAGTDLSDINNSKKTSLADSIHYSELGEQQYGFVMSRFCANMLI